jgi:hypothetical protein
VNHVPAVGYVLEDTVYTRFDIFSLIHVLDIRLGNMLIRAPSELSNLTMSRWIEQFGKPETELVIILDGQPLPPGVLSYVVLPPNPSKLGNSP